MKTTTWTMRIFATLLLVSSLLLLFEGCGQSEDTEKSAKLDVARLQSLPYAGSTPVDADEPQGVTIHDERTCPGFNLTTIYALGTAELFDAAGTVIRSWSRPGETWMHCELLANGDLLVVGAGSVVENGAGQNAFIDDQTRFVARFDWHGRLLWKRRLPGHHDIELAPDGNLLLLGLEYRLIPKFDPKLPVRDDILMRLDPAGNVMTAISLMDAIGHNNGAMNLFRIPPTEESGHRFTDLLHTNSATWIRPGNLNGTHPIYDSGNILVCCRHQNRIAVIDWSARKVVWSWGQNELYGPHDASMLSNGDILIFDNGLREKRSRIVEMDPRRGVIVWQYVADPPGSFFTISKGSAQRLPNGNTLAVESDRGRAIEVTSAGETVWEYVCPHEVSPGRRAAIVDMERFPVAFVKGLMASNGD